MIRHTFRFQLVAASLAVAGSTLAAAEPRLDVGPAYRFLGTHLQSKTFEVEVPIANTGDAPLVVHEVTTDCNCVAGKTDRLSLAPQQKSILRIEIETRDFLGRLRREVRVASNDPQTPTARLVLEYDVVRPITLVPTALHLGVVRPGQRLTRTVAIRVQGDDTLRPLYATASEPAVRVELPEQTVTSRAPAEVFVTIEVPETSGPFAATVTIHTDSRRHSKLTLPIRASVSSDVTLSGPRFELGRFTAATPSESELTVRCGPNSRIKAVSISSKGLRIERHDIDGKTILKLLPTRRLRIGTVSAALRIETTGDEEQTIVVPVSGTLTAR